MSLAVEGRPDRKSDDLQHGYSLNRSPGYAFGCEHPVRAKILRDHYAPW